MSPLEILRQVELLRGLSDPQLTQISQLCTMEHYPNGSVIFTQGSQADKLYIINTGQVEVAVRTQQGETYPAVYLGAGQVLGEMSLVDAGRRSASAIAAMDDTQVYVMRGADLTRLCEEDTLIGYVIMRNIAQDLSFKLRHRDADPIEVENHVIATSD
jgi:CRP-like cAMP-binding protein